MKESDMYPHLKKWLESKGYTVYPEIEPLPGYKRADIVAIKKDQVLIVEMKTKFGLAVMEQAHYWASEGYAHQTYIAVPWRERWEVPLIAQRALEPVGVGVLQVDLRKNPNRPEQMEERLFWLSDRSELFAQRARKRIEEACKSYEDRRIRICLEAKHKVEASHAHRILDMLTPHHLNGPDAGGKTGGHISAHRLTMIRAQEYMSSIDDWVTPKQICENIETHYFAQDKAASLKQVLLAFGKDFCEYQVIKGRGYFRNIKETTI